MAAQAAIHDNELQGGAGVEMQKGRENDPYVYILASMRDGILYVGVTSDLFDRISVHKQDLLEGFTKKYGVHMLVYYEWHATMDEAIKRESQIKKWKRAWKVRLIESVNPEWTDLFDTQFGFIKEAPVDAARFRHEH